MMRVFEPDIKCVGHMLSVLTVSQLHLTLCGVTFLSFLIVFFFFFYRKNVADMENTFMTSFFLK